MAQNSTVNNSINLPYQDLASEVIRHRVTMATGEEIIPEKNYSAKKMVFCSDMETEPSPNKTYFTEPPAPLPLPAKESTVSHVGTT
ncbi:myocilin opposite strand protein-like [Fukomys damarensis]|uniref:myocilin opposite strand protein-like n=1 Tax=Fukomys damarensis TaxID=885580 RepID=UPI0014552D94|nr:myocilin opposite strand protein-like [Fukomys damarensis]